MSCSPPLQDYKRVAVDTIRREHRALAQVLGLLELLLRQISAGHTAADWHLLSLALYYIEDFPCRLHHPKEDEYLFPAMRRHTRNFDGVLDTLEAEHAKDRHSTLELYRGFVRYQAAAPGALTALRLALSSYSTMLYEHMRREEALLDDSGLNMPEAEWRVIAEAFGADSEPLLNPECRREFAVLHNQIVNFLPRKMRLPADARGE